MKFLLCRDVPTPKHPHSIWAKHCFSSLVSYVNQTIFYLKITSTTCSKTHQLAMNSSCWQQLHYHARERKDDQQIGPSVNLTTLLPLRQDTGTDTHTYLLTSKHSLSQHIFVGWLVGISKKVDITHLCNKFTESLVQPDPSMYLRLLANMLKNFKLGINQLRKFWQKYWSRNILC